MMFDICVYEYLTYHSNESNKIMASMLNDEFYIIQDKIYDIFQPIYEDFNGDMIGFFCANLESRNDSEIVIVELGYLLEQYRGQGIFCKNLELFTREFENKQVWLDLPNRFMVQSLLYNNLACKLDDRYVLSDYFLSFRDDKGNRIASKIYDLKYSCIVHVWKECVSPLLDVDAYLFDGSRDFGSDYYSEVVKDLLSCLVIS